MSRLKLDSRVRLFRSKPQDWGLTEMWTTESSYWSTFSLQLEARKTTWLLVSSQSCLGISFPRVWHSDAVLNCFFLPFDHLWGTFDPVLHRIDHYDPGGGLRGICVCVSWEDPHSDTDTPLHPAVVIVISLQQRQSGRRRRGILFVSARAFCRVCVCGCECVCNRTGQVQYRGFPVFLLPQY